MKSIFPQFLKHIKDIQLINPGDTIIVALSGGKDSVTLFHLLHELTKKISFTLKAVYFNHQIRQDADIEQEWVKHFTRQHDVELIIGSKNILEYKRKKKLNLEHAASISRYHFFNQVASDHKQAKIATAHTRSDLSETFLIKLLRGSGLQGLSAIYSQKGTQIIRPLLMFTQEEIFAFLSRNDIQYYRDFTNDHPEFLRNRIRHQLIPAIKKIEPQFNQRIFQTVSIIQEEFEYLREQAKKILQSTLILDQVLPISTFKHLHIAMQRNILREYIRQLKGNLLNIDFYHIEAILIRMNSCHGLAIPGLELKFLKGFIYPRGLTIPDYSYQINTAKSITIKHIQAHLKIAVTQGYQQPASNHHLMIPLAKIKYPLTVRSPSRQDRYIKINSQINQGIFEMIRISGIPADLRNLCPVLINGDQQIIWVKGSPIADSFKVTPQDKPPYLHLSFT